MMQPNEIDFHLRREREEREIAARCVDPAIAAIHVEMAERYAAIVREHQAMARPRLLRLA